MTNRFSKYCMINRCVWFEMLDMWIDRRCIRHYIRNIILSLVDTVYRSRDGILASTWRDPIHWRPFHVSIFGAIPFVPVHLHSRGHILIYGYADRSHQGGIRFFYWKIDLFFHWFFICLLAIGDCRVNCHCHVIFIYSCTKSDTAAPSFIYGVYDKLPYTPRLSVGWLGDPMIRLGAYHTCTIYRISDILCITHVRPSVRRHHDGLIILWSHGMTYHT